MNKKDTTFASSRVLARSTHRRRNKTLFRSVLALSLSLVLCLCGGALYQSGANRAIESNAFILKDKDGHVRAKWDFDEGDPRLLMFDRNGTARTEWTIFPGGEPRFFMMDKDGNRVLAIAVIEDRPDITLYDESSESKINLGSDRTGSYLNLHDGAGELKIGIFASHDGTVEATALGSARNNPYGLFPKLNLEPVPAIKGTSVSLSIPRDGDPVLFFNGHDGNKKLVIELPKEGVTRDQSERE